MIISLIFINKKDFLKAKIKIYYQIIGVIIKYKSNYTFLQKIILPNVTLLEKAAVKNLLMIYADQNIQQFYSIIISIIVN